MMGNREFMIIVQTGIIGAIIVWLLGKGMNALSVTAPANSPQFVKDMVDLLENHNDKALSSFVLILGIVAMSLYARAALEPMIRRM